MKMYKFFLGGADREMAQIRERLLGEAGVGATFEDAGLRWGAKASAYGDKIAEAARDGFTPVLVELEVDCDLPKGTVVVDHHGKRSGEPASLLQVLNLLGRNPTRRDELIAANDTSGPTGLRRLGYSKAEVDEVRSGEYRPNPEIITETLRALDAADAYRMAISGEVVVVRPFHSKCGPIADRLAWLWPTGTTGPVEEKLLVLSQDGEVNFYGNRALGVLLFEKFGGWSGGDDPQKPNGFGFWGAGAPVNHAAVEKAVREFYAAQKA